ncbi:hypothetical protein EJMLMN_EJMLMN_02055, partial [Dysosmobacter welbionis]
GDRRGVRHQRTDLCHQCQPLSQHSQCPPDAGGIHGTVQDPDSGVRPQDRLPPGSGYRSGLSFWRG